MKKRAMFLLLIVCMLCLCFTACGSKFDLKKEIVSANWELTEVFPDEVSTLLESFNFEPEEIAFAAPEDFAFYRVFTFKEDGTAVLAYDTEKILGKMYDAMEKFTEALYDNKEELVEIYGEEMLEYCDTPEKFKDALAYILGEFESADEFYSVSADNIVTYYFASNQYTKNSGTYEIVNDSIQVSLDENQNVLLKYDAEKDSLIDSQGQVFAKMGN